MIDFIIAHITAALTDWRVSSITSLMLKSQLDFEIGLCWRCNLFRDELCACRNFCLLANDHTDVRIQWVNFLTLRKFAPSDLAPISQCDRAAAYCSSIRSRSNRAHDPLVCF